MKDIVRVSAEDLRQAQALSPIDLTKLDLSMINKAPRVEVPINDVKRITIGAKPNKSVSR